jgi:hypothetical protein
MSRQNDGYFINLVGKDGIVAYPWGRVPVEDLCVKIEHHTAPIYEIQIPFHHFEEMVSVARRLRREYITKTDRIGVIQAHLKKA